MRSDLSLIFYIYTFYILIKNCKVYLYYAILTHLSADHPRDIFYSAASTTRPRNWTSEAAGDIFPTTVDTLPSKMVHMGVVLNELVLNHEIKCTDPGDYFPDHSRHVIQHNDTHARRYKSVVRILTRQPMIRPRNRTFGSRRIFSRSPSIIYPTCSRPYLR